MAQYEWVSLYKEIAQKLLKYRSNRKDLIQMVRQVYAETQINLPTLEQENQIVDIDPFTVFGLFNKSSMREEKRRKILAAFRQKLEVSKPLPQTFEGIPVLNNQNATFYYFIGEREESDIEDLWVFFEWALAYAKEKSKQNKMGVSNGFNSVVNKKGNGNSKITMGLYWIAPDVYMNLDSRNEWYIYKSGRVPQEVVNTLPSIDRKINAKQYFEIIEKVQSYLESGSCPQHNFVELSTEAWNYSQKVNDEIKAGQVVQKPELVSVADENVDTVHYWLYAPGNNADKWEEFYREGIMAIGWSDIGDLSTFSSKDAMKAKMREVYDATLSYKNAAHATWQFAKEMKIGDIVFVKKGRNQLIGRGVVTSDYRFDDSRTDDYCNVRSVKWTH